jgi:hypothetical protein
MPTFGIETKEGDEEFPHTHLEARSELKNLPIYTLNDSF